MCPSRCFWTLVLPILAAAEVAEDQQVVEFKQQITAWHAEKAALGATFAGSPAWTAHLQFIERELAQRGVAELQRREVRYQRWFAPATGDGAIALRIGAEAVPVASYWAYSGNTGPAGVSAPMIYYDEHLAPESLAGRIVVFDVSALPERMKTSFQAKAEFFTPPPVDELDGIASDQWYQSNYVTRFGRFDGLLRGSGAAGALVIFDMSPGRAKGLYTFPLLSAEQVGVPGLYLDRVAGAMVREAAQRNATATMVLESRTETALSWFLQGVLPGRNYGTERDEMVLLVTHSDGPNLSQENGTLGILAVVDLLAQIPQQDRQRSVLILLDPQHYMPGRHTVDWYDENPALMSHVVASFGVEHLGQREFGETGNEYGLTGLPEPTLIFAQDNPALIQAAQVAMVSAELPRAELRVPARAGQGRWQGMGEIAVERGLPGYAISSGMSGYWSEGPGLESFDVNLFWRQIAMVAELIGFLMETPLEQMQPGPAD